jgi:hypothetical protein
MIAAMKLHTTVLSGSRVEFTIPELPEGADVEVSVTLSASEPTETAQKFAALADRWKRETAVLSSVSQIAMHPAYQEIIGMGREAIPLILQELEQEPNHWFWALRAITGESPVPPDQRGKMQEMANSWLHWGREQGYLR